VVDGRNVLAIYDVPESTAKTMLDAVECRLLLPDQEITLARDRCEPRGQPLRRV